MLTISRGWAIIMALGLALTLPVLVGCKSAQDKPKLRTTPPEPIHQTLPQGGPHSVSPATTPPSSTSGK